MGNSNVNSNRSIEHSNNNEDSHMPSSPNQIMMTGTPSFYDNGDASDDDSLEEQLQDMMKHCDVSPGDAHKSTSLFDGFEYEEGFTEDAEVYEAIRDALSQENEESKDENVGDVEEEEEHTVLMDSIVDESLGTSSKDGQHNANYLPRENTEESSGYYAGDTQPFQATLQADHHLKAVESYPKESVSVETKELTPERTQEINESSEQNVPKQNISEKKPLQLDSLATLENNAKTHVTDLDNDEKKKERLSQEKHSRLDSLATLNEDVPRDSPKLDKEEEYHESEPHCLSESSNTTTLLTLSENITRCRTSTSGKDSTPLYTLAASRDERSEDLARELGNVGKNEADRELITLTPSQVILTPTTDFCSTDTKGCSIESNIETPDIASPCDQQTTSLSCDDIIASPVACSLPHKTLVIVENCTNSNNEDCVNKSMESDKDSTETTSIQKNLERDAENSQPNRVQDKANTQATEKKWPSTQGGVLSSLGESLASVNNRSSASNEDDDSSNSYLGSDESSSAKDEDANENSDEDKPRDSRNGTGKPITIQHGGKIAQKTSMKRSTTFKSGSSLGWVSVQRDQKSPALKRLKKKLPVTLEESESEDEWQSEKDKKVKWNLSEKTGSVVEVIQDDTSENIPVKPRKAITSYALSQDTEELMAYQNEVHRSSNQRVEESKILNNFLQSIDRTMQLERLLKQSCDKIKVLEEELRSKVEECNTKESLLVRMKRKLGIVDNIKQKHSQDLSALEDDKKKLHVKLQDLMKLRAVCVNCSGPMTGKKSDPQIKSRNDDIQVSEVDDNDSPSFVKNKITRSWVESPLNGSLPRVSIDNSEFHSNIENQESQESEFSESIIETCKESLIDGDLLEPEALLTRNSIISISRIINDKLGDLHPFNRIFNPIWDILKKQGRHEDSKWDYLKSGRTLGPAYVYGTPYCNDIKDGVDGKSYFTSELKLVLFIIDEIEHTNVTLNVDNVYRIRALKEDGGNRQRKRQPTMKYIEANAVFKKKKDKVIVITNQTNSSQMESPRSNNIKEKKSGNRQGYQLLSKSTPTKQSKNTSSDLVQKNCIPSSEEKVNDTPRKNRKIIESSSESSSDEEESIISVGIVEVADNGDEILAPDDILTPSSIAKCTNTINKCNMSWLQSEESFRGRIFCPIWEILKTQGTEKLHEWGYLKVPMKISGAMDYCWAVPGCTNIYDASENKDYFLNEMDLVIEVCRQIQSKLLGKLDTSRFEAIVTLKGDSSTRIMSSRSRRSRDRKDFSKTRNELNFQPQVPKRSRSGDSTLNRKKKGRKMANSSVNDSEVYSQNTLNGASVLLSIGKDLDAVNNSVDPKATKAAKRLSSNSSLQSIGKRPMSVSDGRSLDGLLSNVHVATASGIEKVLQLRRAPIQESDEENGNLNLLILDSNKQASEQFEVPQFHLTQETPPKKSLSFQSPNTMTNKRKSNKMILSGFTFLISGLSDDIRERIFKLGGSVENSIANIGQTTQNIIFLSNHANRRKMKYIFAASMGLPMLHSSWIEEIRLREERNARENTSADVTKTDPFDGRLFKSMRLPLGMSFFSKHYKLQSVSTISDGIKKSKVFDGLRLVLCLDDGGNNNKEWKIILEASGAKIISKYDHSNSPHAILVDPIYLPPSKLAVPGFLSKTFKAFGSSIPLIDIAWAVQCIVNEKTVSFGKDDISGRFGNIDITTGNVNTREVFSIKRDKDGARFEVGDVVKLKRQGNDVFAKIDSFRQKSKVLVHVFERQGRYLVDGGSKTAPLPILTIDIDDISMHVLVLKEKDFQQIQSTYGKNEDNVFIYKKLS